MDFEQREAIICTLDKCEEKYQVESWQIDEIDIWPVLKKIVFFNAFNHNKPYQDPPLGNKNLITRLILKFKRIFGALNYLGRLNIKKSNFLFAGAHHYRVKWDNTDFNRFFDPILDDLEQQKQNGYLLEYLNDEDPAFIYKKNRNINLRKLLPLFSLFSKIRYKEKHFEKLSGFNSFLDEIKNSQNLSSSFLKKELINTLNSIKHWTILFQFLIKKTNAKYAIGLCYYCDEMFGMNFAAYRSGIISIDYQHGAQGAMHVSYNYNKIPERGYNVLPKIFWLWDENSYNEIKLWARNSYHGYLNGGNSWIKFLRKKPQSIEINLNENKPLLVYSLQTSLNPIIDDYLLEAIMLTVKQYQWCLRLHPRMSSNEKIILYGLLDKNSLRKDVIVDEANQTPLPLLLNKCDLHISRYSGVIQEASNLFVPTLIIDEIGVRTFKHLFQNKLAYKCLIKDSAQLIKAIENTLEHSKGNSIEMDFDNTNYKNLFSEIKELVNN